MFPKHHPQSERTKLKQRTNCPVFTRRAYVPSTTLSPVNPSLLVPTRGVLGILGHPADPGPPAFPGDTPANSKSAYKVRPFSIPIEEFTLLQHGRPRDIRETGVHCLEVGIPQISGWREYSACLAWAEDQAFLFFEFWNLIRAWAWVGCSILGRCRRRSRWTSYPIS